MMVLGMLPLLNIILIFFISKVYSETLYGGSIYWRPTGNKNEISFTYRLIWNTGHFLCGRNQTQSDCWPMYLKRKDLFVKHRPVQRWQNYQWRCTSGCKSTTTMSTLDKLQYTDIDQFLDDSWETGVGIFNVTFADQDMTDITFGFVDKNSTLVDGFGEGKLSLAQRNDTNRPNMGPAINVYPVYRAFIAWEEQIVVDPKEEHALRANLEEYKSRLLVRSQVLPDPFTLQGWFNEQGRQNWPSLYFSDIAAYLKMKTPAELYNRLINEYKQGKSYRYFTCGFVKEVHFHPIRDDSPVAFLAAKVTPSMHLSSSPHEAWVCVEKDTTNKPGGQVHSAYCTCTAGLNGCCNHVAAILYRIEYAVRTGLTRPSSTSETCVWNVPSLDKAPNQPILLCEQEWTKDQYLKQNDGHHSKSVKQLATCFTPLTKTQERYVSKEDTVKSDLAEIIRQYAPESCFVQLHDKTPFPSKPKPVCPPNPKEIALRLGHPVTAQELADAMVLTDEEASDLQLATIGQADSEDWLTQRYGRITASNFHRVYTRMKTLQAKPTADPKPLLRALMGYKPEPVSVAIKHGKAMEPHAKKKYKYVVSSKHKRFKAEECGLFIHRDHPFLGASPDLIVSCSCCGKGLCEIKCPESIKDQTPSASNYKHLVNNSLSKSSEYFTQVQGQMAVLQMEYCDFFVYTSKGYHIERIAFDPVFWEMVQKNLVKFWMTYLSDELIYGSLANSEIFDNSLTDHTYNCSEVITLAKHDIPSQFPKSKIISRGPLSKPKLPRLYLCGKCTDVIEDNPTSELQESIECSKCQLWFHRHCAHIRDLDAVSGNQEWLCVKCK